MESKDEILAKEIQKKVKELNNLFADAVKNNGLLVEVEHYEVNVFPYRQPQQRIICRIYKEIL